MKTFAISALSAALLASDVAAFPAKAMDALTAPLLSNALDKRNERLESRQTAAAPQGAGALPATPPPFSASAQYVSNTGTHAVSGTPESFFRRGSSC